MVIKGPKWRWKVALLVKLVRSRFAWQTSHQECDRLSCCGTFHTIFRSLFTEARWSYHMKGNILVTYVTHIPWIGNGDSHSSWISSRWLSVLSSAGKNLRLAPQTLLMCSTGDWSVAPAEPSSANSVGVCWPFFFLFGVIGRLAISHCLFTDSRLHSLFGEHGLHT